MNCAISFCDCMELLNDTWEIEGEAEALYIGSAFCDQYYVNTSQNAWNQAKQLAERLALKVVLVLPIAGPMRLEGVKSLTESLIQEEWIDEVVANDYATYDWLCQRWPDMKLWYGRLLSKDIRDPRYTLNPQQIKLYERTGRSTSAGIAPYGVEADLTELPTSIEQYTNCKLAVHTPLVYLSTGRICEFASIGQSIERKFRPNQKCKRPCVDHSIRYEHHGIRFYKIGRVVYTDRCVPLEALQLLPIRVICTMLVRRETQ